MTSVSFEDCKIDLLNNVTVHGNEQYDKWLARPGYDAVVDFVSSFTHTHLFCISSDEIKSVVERSSHPLGDIRSTEQLDIIEDFSTPFAFQHLFHWYIETAKQVPTWRDFRNWMVTGRAAPYWYLPIKSYLEEHGQAFTKRQWSRASRWRLGKVYMSNVRELDLLVRLREVGLPMRYHLLADVLLRVDFWCQDVLVCVYFPNQKYREGDKGRKPPASLYFDTVNTPFEIIHLGITRQGYGKFWLASEESVAELAAKIKSLLHPE
jgi:hypothetical protein